MRTAASSTWTRIPISPITRSVYGAQFGQSPARLGGGLKNWRPFRLVGAHRDGGGHLLGGHMAFARERPDSRISRSCSMPAPSRNPSTDVKKARFVYNGAELGFYEYVRVAVSGGKMAFNPIYELKATMKTLCNDLRRSRAICRSRHQGRHLGQEPSRRGCRTTSTARTTMSGRPIPRPSRDARIKTAFAQFYKDLAEMIDLWVHRDPRIVYDGLFLQKDLREAYDGAIGAVHDHLSEHGQETGAHDLRRHDAAAVQDVVRSLSLRRTALGRGGRRTKLVPGRQGKAQMVRCRAAPAKPARPHL